MKTDSSDIQAELEKLDAALVAAERLVTELLAIHCAELKDAISTALMDVYSTIVFILMRRRRVEREFNRRGRTRDVFCSWR
jgi:hypothetical protein